MLVISLLLLLCARALLRCARQQGQRQKFHLLWFGLKQYTAVDIMASFFCVFFLVQRIGLVLFDPVWFDLIGCFCTRAADDWLH